MKSSNHTIIILILLAAVTILIGCHEQSRYRNTQGRLDKALYYYEVDRQNELYGISREIEDRKSREPSRVPTPALVDIDSQVHVLVSEKPLDSETEASFSRAASATLLERKEDIQKALEALATTVESRAEAIRLYEQGDPKTSGRTIDKFEKAEGELIKTLRGLWSNRSTEYKIISDAYRNIRREPKLTPIYKLLQSELDAIKVAEKSLVDRLREKRISLRLEAQVMGEYEDPLFIHMEGYDKMEQGQLQVRDRWGLNLSPEDSRRLEEQVKATQEVAIAAERLRRKEISYKEALASAGPFISEELTTSIQEIQKLVDKYDADGTQKKLDEIADLYAKLTAKIEDSASDLSDELKAELRATPEDFKNWIKANHFERLPKLFAGLTAVEDLARRWRNPTYADQASLFIDSARVFRDFRALLDDNALLIEIAQAVTQYIDSRAPALSEIVEGALEDIEDSEEFKALENALGEIQKDLNHFEDIAKRLAYFARAREPEEVPSPHTFDVPIEDIRDTFMDLQRARLSLGDEIMLRGTLKEGDKEVDSTTASFKVSRLRWYAELSPSVVLVRPEHLEGNEDDFQFAPALSWLHHYVPRPQEKQWYMDMLRALDPAFGLHTIFLSFDTPQDDESIQIGLGATLSFWDERLQFGSGYNFMADEKDDGQIYFFIGTDLVGLLHNITGNQMR